jgi:hypothetical protein
MMAQRLFALDVAKLSHSEQGLQSLFSTDEAGLQPAQDVEPNIVWSRPGVISPFSGFYYSSGVSHSVRQLHKHGRYLRNGIRLAWQL